jgi:hypothetical protein
MTKRNHDLVEVCVILKHETPKAWLFTDADRDVWIPKSQAEYDPASLKLELPEWLAIEKGLV